MSYFECSDCGKRHEIFGSGGAKRRAKELQVPFLGELPINTQIRVRGDEGATGHNFDDESSAPYLESLCVQLVRNLVSQPTDASPLPSL